MAGILELVIAPLLTNLGSEAVVRTWDGFLADRRRGWDFELARVAWDATSGFYKPWELRAWLQEPGVLEHLSAGRPDDLQYAANALSGSIAGDAIRGPADAGVQASTAVCALEMRVLEFGPDVNTRLLARAVRATADADHRLVSMDSLLRDVMAGQSIQDEDLRDIRWKVDRLFEQAVLVEQFDADLHRRRPPPPASDEESSPIAELRSMGWDELIAAVRHSLRSMPGGVADILFYELSGGRFVAQSASDYAFVRPAIQADLASLEITHIDGHVVAPNLQRYEIRWLRAAVREVEARVAKSAVERAGGASPDLSTRDRRTWQHFEWLD